MTEILLFDILSHRVLFKYNVDLLWYAYKLPGKSKENTGSSIEKKLSAQSFKQSWVNRYEQQ